MPFNWVLVITETNFLLKNNKKNTYPRDCKPSINSFLENSHMVPAFMCHERTNCKNVNIPSYQKHSYVIRMHLHHATKLSVGRVNRDVNFMFNSSFKITNINSPSTTYCIFYPIGTYNHHPLAWMNESITIFICFL